MLTRHDTTAVLRTTLLKTVAVGDRFRFGTMQIFVGKMPDHCSEPM